MALEPGGEPEAPEPGFFEEQKSFLFPGARIRSCQSQQLGLTGHAPQASAIRVTQGQFRDGLRVWPRPSVVKTLSYHSE